MIRQHISISDLKDHIRLEWRPVWAAIGEDDDGNPLQVVEVDMICEWRVPDGKVRFVRVLFESPEELEEIKQVLTNSITPFADELRRWFQFAD